MNNIFGFENLAAYQRAMDLVDNVYDLMKGFPPEERFALCDQLRRAVVSVPSNIAEGLGRLSKKEQVRFIEISYGSLKGSGGQELLYSLNVHEMKCA